MDVCRPGAAWARERERRREVAAAPGRALDGLTVHKRLLLCGAEEERRSAQIVVEIRYLKKGRCDRHTRRGVRASLGRARQVRGRGLLAAV